MSENVVKRYRDKIPPVEALRWGATIESAEAVCRLQRDDDPEIQFTDDAEVHVHQDGEIVVVQPGEWIIRNPDGHYLVARNDVFERCFEVVQ